METTTARASTRHIEPVFMRFTFAQCTPDPAEVCRAMGYPAGETPEVALDAIQELFDRGEELWSLQGGYTVYPDLAVDKANHRLIVGDAAFDVGKIVCGQLSRSSSLAVFLCTAGPGIQQLMQDTMSAGDPFTSYLASWVGSLTVEKAMDNLQDDLARLATGLGLHVTNRYSPGYCGWHVSEQQKLFGLLPKGLCDVRLTDTSLMQPIKTVSGFVGVGERVRFNAYTCNICDHNDCIYRTINQERRDKAREAHG